MNQPTKPRVLHVVDSLEIGGLERLVHDLILERGGDCTSVACIVKVGPFGEALRKQGIRVDLIGTKGGFLLTVWRLWRYLRRMRPDLLHCHNHFAVLNGSVGAWLAGGMRVVMTKHGAMVPGQGLGSRLNRVFIRRVRVVAVSEQAAAIMRAWMPAGSPPVRTIANGISTAPYENLPAREAARAQLGLPKASFIAGIVARVSGQKGHLLLVDVFARLLQKVPGALLLIVGDGVAMADVKSRVQELGLEQKVLLMGARNDVHIVLRAMDVFCLPSEMEGMPMTVLEAMAAGIPVVTSNVGGIPELVEEGKTGLMVPPRSQEPLEAALLALAGDADRARAMGRAGKERLLRAFSLEQTIAAYESVYRDAAG